MFPPEDPSLGCHTFSVNREPGKTLPGAVPLVTVICESPCEFRRNPPQRSHLTHLTHPVLVRGWADALRERRRPGKGTLLNPDAFSGFVREEDPNTVQYVNIGYI
jgi:hypothetical protein